MRYKRQNVDKEAQMFLTPYSEQAIDIKPTYL